MLKIVGELLKKCLLLAVFDDVFHNRLESRIIFHLFFHLADGIDDRRVISSSEFGPDLLHGVACDLADDIHGGLSRCGDIGVLFVGTDIVGGNDKCS